MSDFVVIQGSTIQVPNLIATRMSSESCLVEGTTGPLKIDCASINELPNGEPYVVKFYSKVAHKGFGIVCEIIAGNLARHFEILTPDCAMIEITQSFRDSVLGNTRYPSEIWETINQNVGPSNFGSKFIPTNTQNYLSVKAGKNGVDQIAEDVFAFDALIYNADRTDRTPNLFLAADKITIFDHEKSFHFAVHDNWQISKDHGNIFHDSDGRSLLSDHIFQPLLRKTNPTFANFTERLRNLDSGKIHDIVGCVPYPLHKKHEEQINRVEKYLLFARDNAEYLQVEMRRAVKNGNS